MTCHQYAMGGREILFRSGTAELQQDSVMDRFRSHGLIDGDTIRLEMEVADLSFLQSWDMSVYTSGYELRHKEGRTFLLNHWATHRFAYGVYLDELHGREPLRIYYNGQCFRELAISPRRLLGAVGLHHRIMQGGAGIFHASYVNYKGRGILFAAPSQVGKSTQADLWHRYADAEIINGDRAILIPEGQGWSVGGFFNCGSSGICLNKTLPLGAVVFLEQGSENSIRQCAEKEAIHRIFTGLEFFHWDTEDVDQALSVAGRLAKELPLLHFSCRPDEDAVRTLREYLEVNLFHETV